MVVLGAVLLLSFLPALLSLPQYAASQIEVCCLTSSCLNYGSDIWELTSSQGYGSGSGSRREILNSIKNSRKFAIIVFIKIVKSKFGPAPCFFLYFWTSFCFLFLLLKTFHRSFLSIFSSWIRIRINKAARSGGVLRITAGSGSAKNYCGSTALRPPEWKTPFF